MSSSPLGPTKRADIRARDAEYQSLWQVFGRISRRDDYAAMTTADRRAVLQGAADTILNIMYVCVSTLRETLLISPVAQRRHQGKRMSYIDIPAMITRHLTRESLYRVAARRKQVPQYQPFHSYPRPAEANQYCQMPYQSPSALSSPRTLSAELSYLHGELEAARKNNAALRARLWELAALVGKLEERAENRTTSEGVFEREDKYLEQSEGGSGELDDRFYSVGGY